MQGLFIFTLFIAALAVLSGSAWLITASVQRRRPDDDRRDRYGDRAGPETTRFWAKIATIGLAALTGILTLACSFWIVGTQNIGIVTSFGKPVGEVGNGAQWTWPWQQVHDMDYSVQVTDFPAAGCQIQLRLSEGQTACAKVAVRWQVNTRAADALFRRYKGSTQGVENGVLIPELQNTANQVFAGYDPVALLNSTAPVGSPRNPTVPQLAQQVKDQLSATIGDEVQIISLFMPNIAYSPQVQQRINAVLAQKAQTLIAQQSEQTATAQAAANKAISASVSHDPNVLVAQCLNIMQEIVKNGDTPPVNMCNLGGSGTGVIVSGR